jgi:uncharacterized membrane protein YgaE (UPF0421/DUF939 family)
MLERIRWWLASLFAYWALELMRPETAEDGFSMTLTNAEKNGASAANSAARRSSRRSLSKQAEIERLRNQPMGQLHEQSEEQIDPQTLSMSARQKLEAAIRQQKRNLQAEFDQAVQTEVARAIEATVLPQYNKEMADARQVISRKGMTLCQEYLLITSCLRPDQSASKERLNEACIALDDPENTLSIQLLSREGLSAVPKVSRFSH